MKKNVKGTLTFPTSGGSGDFPKPAEEARWVADQLRGSMAMVPGAGHYPHAVFPEVVGPMILESIQDEK